MAKEMLRLEFANQFHKDLARMQKRGKDTNKVKAIIEKLLAQEPLPARYKDHKLHGEFVNQRECHLEADWLLVYTRGTTVIRLERTGSHADLFE